MQNILCFVYFAKDVEDWFGYEKLSGVYVIQMPHVSVLRLNINNGRTTITTTSDISTTQNILHVTYE